MHNFYGQPSPVFSETEQMALPVTNAEELTIPGHVYLAWAEGTPRYKIGHAINVKQRIYALNSVLSPYPIGLVHSFPTDDMLGDKKKLQTAFEAYRVHNEWFELPQEAVELIKLMKEGFKA